MARRNKAPRKKRPRRNKQRLSIDWLSEVQEFFYKALDMCEKKEQSEDCAYKYAAICAMKTRGISDPQKVEKINSQVVEFMEGFFPFATIPKSQYKLYFIYSYLGAHVFAKIIEWKDASTIFEYLRKEMYLFV